MRECRVVRLKGRVFSGLGEGSYYMSIYARSFARVLGFRPYPGTLNVRLNEESARIYESCTGSKGSPIVVEPPDLGGDRLARVRVWPATIRGVSVYIVRPDVTVYTGRVLEVIAADYLRELLGLSDGDLVEIEVECCV